MSRRAPHAAVWMLCWVIGLSSSAALGLVSAHGSEGTVWRVPVEAWSRPLGAVPTDAAAPAKRGIPLGGFGAGSMMFNLAGSFGPWELYPGYHSELFLSQAAFHFWERAADGGVLSRTLATDDVLAAWPRTAAGSATYHAMYPRAWVLYEGFRATLSLKALSPIIKGNYRETSYPVAVFEFLIANNTVDDLETAVMFTFPNLPYARPQQVRTGLTNEVVERADGIRGVVMSAEDPRNSSETNLTQWVIAAAPPTTRSGASLASSQFRISHRAVWNGAGDGSDIWNDFSADGMVESGPYPASTEPAGALATWVLLRPGEAVVVPFVLAWDFPIVEFGSGAQWYRRYTEYFGGPARDEPGRRYPGRQGVAIAAEAVRNRAAWERAIENWQGPVLADPAYPSWLKTAALNELYYDAFGGTLWENGPVNFILPALDPDADHRFFVMESQTYPYAETLDVRHYSTRHRLVLWPDIERDVLLAWAGAVMADRQGRVPHDAGWVGQAAPQRQDPYRTWDAYGAREKGWKDLSSRFMQQVWAYYDTAKDRVFLAKVWPAVKSTYVYMKLTDRDGDGLPDNQGHDTTYDTLPLYGASSLAAGLWIGALEAARAMARVLDDPISAQLGEDIERARASFERRLWSEEPGYYLTDTDGALARALHSDGLNGQRYVETHGLDDIAPLEHITSHYHRVFEWAVKPGPDFNGDGVGDVGAANVVAPGGRLLGQQQGDEVWTGVSYFLAAQMYRAGRRARDTELLRRALLTAYGVYYQTYVNESTAYWFATPEAWIFDAPEEFRALQYQRPLAIWELLLEIKDPYGACEPDAQTPSAAQLWAELEASTKTGARARQQRRMLTASLTEDIRLYGSVLVHPIHRTIGARVRAGDGRVALSAELNAWPPLAAQADGMPRWLVLPGIAFESPFPAGRPVVGVEWKRQPAATPDTRHSGTAIEEHWTLRLGSGPPRKEEWSARLMVVRGEESHLWADVGLRRPAARSATTRADWLVAFGAGVETRMTGDNSSAVRHPGLQVRFGLEGHGLPRYTRQVGDVGVRPDASWEVQLAMARPSSGSSLGRFRLLEATPVAGVTGASGEVAARRLTDGNVAAESTAARPQWMGGARLSLDIPAKVPRWWPVAHRTVWGPYVDAALVGHIAAEERARFAAGAGIRLFGAFEGGEVSLCLAWSVGARPVVQLVASGPIPL